MSDSDAFSTWWWSEARTVACAKQHAWEVWQAAAKAETADLQAENERLRALLHRNTDVINTLGEWTHQMGSELIPRRADTYGEGVRDAKAQVKAMLLRTS